MQQSLFDPVSEFASAMPAVYMRDEVVMRDYQALAFKEIIDALNRNRSALVIMPTGSGKTVVFSAVAKHEIESGGRVLVIAHRDQLITQAHGKLEEIIGLDVGTEKAGSFSAGRMCVVASVQSLHPKRLSKNFKPSDFDVIIVDEAHHAVSKSYTSIFEYFTRAKLLGFTATPDRADQKNVGAVFEKIAFVYPLTQAIKEGWLAPIIGVRCEDEIDLSGLSISGGDLSERELEEVIENSIGPIARGIQEKSGGKKTLAFTPRIKSAELLAKALCGLGMTAASISSNQDDAERKQVLQDFKKGRISVLCNCGIFTEGFDEPSIECVAIARPTLSRALFAQMVGRGTRPFPGKESMTLLEFTFNSGRHRLVTGFELFAGEKITDRVRDAAARRANGQEQINFLDALDFEAGIIKKSVARVRLSGSGRYATFDPLAYCDVSGFDIAGEMDFSDFESARKEFGVKDPERFQKVWNLPVTDKQKNFLGFCGFEMTIISGLTKWQASRLIGKINKEADGGKPWGVVRDWYAERIAEEKNVK